jgi:two-component system sensor histidine kinase YesM
MAVLNNDPKVADVIASLGRLLEVSIKRTDEEIFVNEELSFLKDYIDIMKLTHANNFKVKFSICENILEKKILKLTLQPLVENAIIHGLAGAKGKGRIMITGYKYNGYLIFKVEDNGAGIKEGLNNKLLDEEFKENVKKLNSLGINSINQRIKIYYGNQYGLSIDSKENKGTNVIVKLPLIETETN